MPLAKPIQEDSNDGSFKDSPNYLLNKNSIEMST
jgi:hypothetical protein